MSASLPRPEMRPPELQAGTTWPPSSRGVCPSRVSFYTAPHAMQEPGGGEVQLLKTAEHLHDLGVDVRLFDPWGDRLERADWLHLFGTLPECLEMARLAKRRGVRIALSTVSWYDPWVNWKLQPNLGRKLRGLASWSTRRIRPSTPSWRRELIHLADLLLPNSEVEARQLKQLFGADPSRIAVVPNGADARFAHGDATLFEEQYGVRDFVLVPGRIEPRKNQLAVIRALWGSGISVVILGDPHPAHGDYYSECVRDADPGVSFVGRLDHDSPLLASAYTAGRVVVLASWFETPGLAALEGALAGANIVVTERGCTRDYFGGAASYVRPNDLAGIRSAIRDAMIRPRTGELRDTVQRQFLWDNVARKTLAAYERAAGPWRVAGLKSDPLAAAA